MKKVIFITLLGLLCLGNNIQAKKTDLQQSYSYTRGVENYRAENYNDALSWFNNEISENPDNGFAFTYISLLRYWNYEYGSALTAINNAIKYLPKKDKDWRVTALSTRSKIYAALGDTVAAINDLNHAVEIDPENLKPYQDRAQIYFEQKIYNLADADYRKMISIDPGNVTGFMGLGRNASSQQNWDEAIKQFSHAIKLSSDYSSGYSFRAEAYLGQEKWIEAADDIITALDIDADSKAFLLLQEFPKDELYILKSKLKIKQAKQPSENSWSYYLGILSEVNDDYEDAISYYQQAHGLDADSAILERISGCYKKLHQYNQALDYIERALSMNPNDYDFIDLKADILNRLGRYDECIAERDKYVAQYPEYALSYFSRAEDLMNAKRFKEAIEDYNTAAVILPGLKGSSYFFMKRGDAYRLSGRKDNADSDYNTILTIENDSTLSSHSWTPFAYSGLGNEEKALETMQYIIENDTTNHANNLYNLACIYARLGNEESAIRTLKMAIDEGYNEFYHIKSDYDLHPLHNNPHFVQLIKSLEDNQDFIKPVNSEANDHSYEKVVIPFTKEAGVTKVKCTINGLPLYFVFDTGAADVTMSMVEANFMLKNDYIKPEDIRGAARYVDANGDISEGTVINLRNVNFGGVELDNVRASVVRNQKAPLLLGQSVLGRLGKIEIDNANNQLIIFHKTK